MNKNINSFFISFILLFHDSFDGLWDCCSNLREAELLELKRGADNNIEIFLQDLDKLDNPDSKEENFKDLIIKWREEININKRFNSLRRNNKIDKNIIEFQKIINNSTVENFCKNLYKKMTEDIFSSKGALIIIREIYFLICYGFVTQIKESFSENKKLTWCPNCLLGPEKKFLKSYGGNYDTTYFYEFLYDNNKSKNILDKIKVLTKRDKEKKIKDERKNLY